MRIRNGFFDRREFLRNSGMFAAALAAGQTKSRQIKSPTRPLLDLSKLERFVDPLPIPGVLRPKGMRTNPDNPSAVVPYYRISMKAAAAKIHRDLRPTEFWGFGQSFPGPTIETRSGEGLLVEWVNDLPKEHFLPIDHGVHGAEAEKPPVRVVTHLHGGKVPPKATVIPRIGTFRENPRRISIQTSRRRRISGITTTPWASRGSTFTRDSSDRFLCGILLKTD